MQLSLAGGRTQIILESASPLRFTLYSLRNPDRLTLVLEGVEPGAALAAANAILDDDQPHLKRLRMVPTGPGSVRLEMDLKAEVEPRITSVPPSDGLGYRLVLDLQAATNVAQERGTPAQQPVAQGEEGVAGEEVWLAVRVNQQVAADNALLLKRQDGRLLVRGEDLERWRLRLPEVPPVRYGGEAFYPLDALRGLSYQVDEPNQTLVAEATPGLFATSVIKARGSGFANPAPPEPGGFINYELHADGGVDGVRKGALFELGTFGRLGVGVANFVWRDATERRPFVRLDTTFTHDRPGELASLRLGDSISGASAWGRPVRFGGVQWGRNFATQPGFVPFPQPGLSGEAALPSTVDLYINGALRMRRDVPMGLFSIQDLPIVTGEGEARLVVRDLFGRERLITQPFYGSTRLLQQGLHDFSYEAGFVREDYGMASGQYGRALVAGTHRLGLTDRFTAEVRGELLRNQQSLGLGGALLWPGVGVLNGALAGSRSSAGAGSTLLLGFDRQSRSISFGASTQLASERFSQIGLQPGERAPSQLSRAFVSFASGTGGSFGAGYTIQRYRDRDEIRLLSASYSVGLGRLGFLGINAVRFLGPQAGTTLSLTLAVPLDERTSGSFSATSQSGGTQTGLQVQRSLPAGSGFGYRLFAGGGTSDRREGGVSLQNGIGTYNLDVGEAGGQSGWRAGASGGIALLGGEASLARRITDSFAMVRVPDHPNVRIYADNQLVGRTDAGGKALLPRLRPYEKNVIRVDEGDLPLDTQIDAAQIDAVPYFRSGLTLDFPVRHTKGGLLSVVLADGKPLPAGAVVRLEGQQREFPVGERGEVFVTGLGAMNRVKAEWGDLRCEFDLPFAAANDDPLPHLGTRVCKGAAR